MIGRKKFAVLCSQMQCELSTKYDTNELNINQASMPKYYTYLLELLITLYSGSNYTKAGVPQGSLLGPAPVHIRHQNMICTFADDTATTKIAEDAVRKWQAFHKNINYRTKLRRTKLTKSVHLNLKTALIIPQYSKAFSYNFIGKDALEIQGKKK